MTSVNFMMGPPAPAGAPGSRMSLGAMAEEEHAARARRLGTDGGYVFDEKANELKGTAKLLDLLLEYTPGARAFLELPTLPSSIVPAGADCGFTRARHIFYQVLTDPGTRVGFAFFIMMVSAIIVSIITFCTQSMPEYRIRAEKQIYGTPEATFDSIETVCVAIFSFEFIGRFLCATAVPSERELAYVAKFGFQQVHEHPAPLSYPTNPAHFLKWCRVAGGKMLRFIFSPLNIIDVVAIAPYYVNLLTHSEIDGSLVILRVLRLARVLRLFRMSHRMEGVQILASTVGTALDALGFLLFFLAIATVLFGSIIFFCEAGEWDPDTETFLRPNLLHSGWEESPFKSIPHSFYWTIVTITTIGYGDMYPTTDAGRTLATFIQLCGIMVLALPITVVGSAFTEEYSKFKERKLTSMLEVEQAKANAEQQQLQQGEGLEDVEEEEDEYSSADEASKPSEGSNGGALKGTPDKAAPSSKPVPVEAPPKSLDYTQAQARPAGSGPGQGVEMVPVTAHGPSSTRDPSGRNSPKAGAAQAEERIVVRALSANAAAGRPVLHSSTSAGAELEGGKGRSPVPSRRNSPRMAPTSPSDSKWRTLRGTMSLGPVMQRHVAEQDGQGQGQGQGGGSVDLSSGIGLQSSSSAGSGWAEGKEKERSRAFVPNIVGGTAMFPRPSTGFSSKAERELDLLIALRGRKSRLAQAVSRAAAVKLAEKQFAAGVAVAPAPSLDRVSSFSVQGALAAAASPGNQGIGLGRSLSASSSEYGGASTGPGQIIVSLTAEDILAVASRIGGGAKRKEEDGLAGTRAGSPSEGSMTVGLRAEQRSPSGIISRQTSNASGVSGSGSNSARSSITSAVGLDLGLEALQFNSHGHGRHSHHGHYGHHRGGSASVDGLSGVAERIEAAVSRVDGAVAGLQELRGAIESQHAEIALLRADNAWMRATMQQMLELLRQGQGRSGVAAAAASVPAPLAAPAPLAPSADGSEVSI